MEEAPGNLRGRFAQRIDDVREYGRIAGVAEIARRYFAMNAFDGVLTTIGVVMGSYIGRVRDAGSLVHIGLATSISMGVSGLWGAYLTEAAERQRELTELERLSFTDLSHTKIGRASRMAVVTVALVDGLAPLLGALIVLIPFFIASLIGNILVSYVLSLTIGLLSLFGLGMFLGQISGRSLIGYGLRTLVAGLVSIGLSFLMDRVDP